MVPWLIPILSSTASGICSFFGGYLYGQKNGEGPSQVGVVDYPQQTHLIEIVNSTNIRLDSLADQHNTHRSAVEQFMLLGSLVFGLALVVVLIIGCIGCRYCYRMQRRMKHLVNDKNSCAQRQEASDTFGSTLAVTNV